MHRLSKKSQVETLFLLSYLMTDTQLSSKQTHIIKKLDHAKALAMQRTLFLIEKLEREHYKMNRVLIKSNNHEHEHENNEDNVNGTFDFVDNEHVNFIPHFIKRCRHYLASQSETLPCDTTAELSHDT